MHAGTVSPLRLPQDAGPAVGRARRHAARRYVAVALAAATAILTGAMVLGADPAPTPLVRAAPPGATLADAARAADRGDVLTAVGIAADLGQPEQDRIRRKISRVLAAQAAAAVAAGDRPRARRLLRRASGFASTPQLDAAVAAYERSAPAR